MQSKLKKLTTIGFFILCMLGLFTSGVVETLGASNIYTRDKTIVYNAPGRTIFMGVEAVYDIGVYISGYSNGDLYALKLDQNYEELWNSTQEGHSGYIGGEVIIESENGSVYIIGTNRQPNTLLWQFNAEGELVWQKQWDYSEEIAIYDGILGYHNSFFVVGKHCGSNPEMILIKFDIDGNELWNITWGNPLEDLGRGIVLDSTGNIVITGRSENGLASRWDCVVIKYAPNGYQIWNKTLDADVDLDLTGQYGRGLQIDDDDNLYVLADIGYDKAGTWSNRYPVIYKLNENGDVQWKLDLQQFNYASIYDLTSDTNGNLIFTGFHDNGEEGNRPLIGIVSPSGSLLWSDIYRTEEMACFYEASVDVAGNIFVVGKHGVDGLITVYSEFSGIPGPTFWSISGLTLIGILFAVVYISVQHRIKIK